MTDAQINYHQLSRNGRGYNINHIRQQGTGSQVVENHGMDMSRVNPALCAKMLPEMQSVLRESQSHAEALSSRSGLCDSRINTESINVGSTISEISLPIHIPNGHQNLPNAANISHQDSHERYKSLFIQCSKGSLNDVSPDLVKKLGSLPIAGFMVVDCDHSPGIVIGLPMAAFLNEVAVLRNQSNDRPEMNGPGRAVSHGNEMMEKRMFPFTELKVKRENISDDEEMPCQKEGAEYMGQAFQNEPEIPRAKKYACTKCDRSYYALSHLKAHVRAQHTYEKPYVCDICGNSYARSDSLSAHKRLHYGIKKYRCEHCGKGFGYHTHWKIHLRTHDKKKPYHCYSCQKSFISDADFNYHAVHCKSPLLRCEACSFETSKTADLQEHLKTHSEGQKRKCNYCNKRFSNTRDLDRHKSLHCKAESLVCSHCDVLFGSRKKLLIHRRLYRIHGKKKYLCLDCGMKFSELHHFKRHRFLQHSVHEKVSYQCQECFINFDSKIALSRHTRKVHYKESQWGTLKQILTLTCDLCTFRCSNKWNFEEHFANLHPSFFPYKCKQCKLRFRSQDEIRDHSEIHVSSFLQDTFPCCHCFDVFFGDEALRRHLIDNNVHLSEQELSMLCAKGNGVKDLAKPDTNDTSNSSDQFDQRNSMLTLNVGGGFECDFCAKELSSAFHVKEHFLMYHNSLPPYKCSKCRIRFVAPLLRQRHEVKEHHLDLYAEESADNCVGENYIPTKMDREMHPMHGNKQQGDNLTPTMDYSGSLVDGELAQGRRAPKRKAAQQRSFSQYSFANIELDYDQENMPIPYDNAEDSKKRADVKPRAYTVVHCDICNEVLVTAMKAKEHFIKFHSGIGPYKCDICDQRFQSLYIRKNHMLKHQEDTGGTRKRFPCDRCGKTFLKSYSLREHLLRHSQNDEKFAESGQRVSLSPKRQELVCDLCGTMLVTALKAKEHFIEHHEGMGPYKCFVCDKRLWSMHTRKEHMALHEDFSMLRNTYTCEKCNKTFAKKASLQEHLLRHTKAETAEFVKNELGQYPCKLCTEVFHSLDEVATHFNDCHDKLGCHEDKTFRRLQIIMCDLCGEKLVTGIKAKSHFVEKHNGLPPYCCSKCDKRFHSAYARNKHLLSHEENFHELRPKFPCPKCDKIFCSKFTLKKHSAVHLTEDESEIHMSDSQQVESHTSENQSADDEGDVVYEVRVEEEDTIEIIEPLETDIEPKPKNRRKGIYSSQQGDLDFSCVYCGSSFRYSHHLVTHMMKQHPEEEVQVDDVDLDEDGEKHCCELCGSIIPEYRVAEHFLTTHGGVSLNYCFICDKTFQVHDERDLHLAMHQSEER